MKQLSSYCPGHRPSAGGCRTTKTSWRTTFGVGLALATGVMFAVSAPERSSAPPVESIVCMVEGTCQSMAVVQQQGRALKLYDTLRRGETVQVNRGGRLKLVFESGDLWELVGPAKATIVRGRLTRSAGECHLNKRGSRLNLAPVITGLSQRRSMAAIRVRGNCSEDQVVLSAQAVLCCPTTSSAGLYDHYQFKVWDAAGKEIFYTDSNQPSVEVPAGTLKPGRSYTWSGWGVGEDRPRPLVDEALLQTVPAKTVHIRQALRARFQQTQDVTWLLLLAGWDTAQGLSREAEAEMDEARKLAPGSFTSDEKE